MLWPWRHDMAINLNADTQKRVEEKLKSGEYCSADELVCAAIDALDEIEAHGLDKETIEAIERGNEQIERGEVFDWKDVREQIRKKFLQG